MEGKGPEPEPGGGEAAQLGPARPEGPGVPVVIASLTGAQWQEEISPADTVESLKRKIQDRQGIPSRQQRLLFQQQQVYDRASFSCAFWRLNADAPVREASETLFVTSSNAYYPQEVLGRDSTPAGIGMVNIELQGLAAFTAIYGKEDLLDGFDLQDISLAKWGNSERERHEALARVFRMSRGRYPRNKSHFEPRQFMPDVAARFPPDICLTTKGMPEPLVFLFSSLCVQRKRWRQLSAAERQAPGAPRQPLPHLPDRARRIIYNFLPTQYRQKVRFFLFDKSCLGKQPPSMFTVHWSADNDDSYFVDEEGREYHGPDGRDELFRRARLHEAASFEEKFRREAGLTTNIEVTVWARTVGDAIADAQRAAKIDEGVMGRRYRTTEDVENADFGRGHFVLGRTEGVAPLLSAYNINAGDTLHLILSLVGCDRRLKRDVQYIGATPEEGIPLYRFRYNRTGRHLCQRLGLGAVSESNDEDDDDSDGDGTTYVGTMAQDLLDMGRPWADAVIRLPPDTAAAAAAAAAAPGGVCAEADGGGCYLGVDYGMLPAAVPFRRVA